MCVSVCVHVHAGICICVCVCVCVCVCTLEASTVTVPASERLTCLHRYTRGLTSVAGCTNCPGGKYCPYSNMTLEGPDCDAGYYCSGGSPVNTPVNQTYGDECPPGTLELEEILWQGGMCLKQPMKELT